MLGNRNLVIMFIWKSKCSCYGKRVYVLDKNDKYEHKIWKYVALNNSIKFC